MNIGLIRLKGVIKELRFIGSQLERLADCWETELAEQGIRMRVKPVDTSGPEPSMEYSDEEMDWVRENIARYRKEDEAQE